MDEQLKQATSQVAALSASLDLARKRVAQNTELVATGAGNRFDLEQAQTNVNELTASSPRRAPPSSRCAKSSSGRVKRRPRDASREVKAQIATAQAQVQVAEAQVETTRAQLENARGT